MLGGIGAFSAGKIGLNAGENWVQARGLGAAGWSGWREKVVLAPLMAV